MNIDTEAIKADFVQVAALAGIILRFEEVECESLMAPHKPPKGLPKGRMAVYAFCTSDECLKVGKVGKNSHARFTSQHYNPDSSGSNLAKSLLNDKTKQGLDRENIKAYIMQNTTRYHFFLDATQPSALLSLLEAYLQCRLHPVYEGG